MKSGAHIRLVLGKTSKAVEKFDRVSIADTGLNLSDFTILEALLHKGPLPINTIGKKVLLTSGSMTAAVNRLEKKEYVKRIQDPSDGRSFFVHLTRSGRKKIKTAFEKHEKKLESLAGALVPEEREELVRLLKKLGKQAQDVQST